MTVIPNSIGTSSLGPRDPMALKQCMTPGWLGSICCSLCLPSNQGSMAWPQLYFWPWHTKAPFVAHWLLIPGAGCYFSTSAVCSSIIFFTTICFWSSACINLTHPSAQTCSLWPCPGSGRKHIEFASPEVHLSGSRPHQADNWDGLPHVASTLVPEPPPKLFIRIL